MADRVLIVDDDDSLRESLQLVLSAEGYEVVGAPGAGDALRAVERAPFEVILCDIRMPGVDGMELLPQLVRRLPGTAVIMMSAS
jgi:DNA-binding NtrC family response regulator